MTTDLSFMYMSRWLELKTKTASSFDQSGDRAYRCLIYKLDKNIEILEFMSQSPEPWEIVLDMRVVFRLVMSDQ